MADYIRNRATEDEAKGAKIANEFLKNVKPKLADLKQKSDRLTEAYIDGLLGRAEFAERKQIKGQIGRKSQRYILFTQTSFRMARTGGKL